MTPAAATRDAIDIDLMRTERAVRDWGYGHAHLEPEHLHAVRRGASRGRPHLVRARQLDASLGDARQRCTPDASMGVLRRPCGGGPCVRARGRGNASRTGRARQPYRCRSSRDASGLGAAGRRLGPGRLLTRHTGGTPGEDVPGSRGLIGRHMLPDTHNNPTNRAEPIVDQLVPANVTVELGGPVVSGDHVRWLLGSFICAHPRNSLGKLSRTPPEGDR